MVCYLYLLIKFIPFLLGMKNLHDEITHNFQIHNTKFSDLAQNFHSSRFNIDICWILKFLYNGGHYKICKNLITSKFLFCKFVMRDIQNLNLNKTHLAVVSLLSWTIFTGWDIGPYYSQTGKADVLIDHARFDEKFVSAHFHSDAPLIVSVREPVTWFQSAVRFWHKHLKGGKYLKAEKILVGSN